MNAVLQDFCEIGEEAMIAAGSVVTDRMIIPARHLAAGIPAQVKKEIAGSSLMWVTLQCTLLPGAGPELPAARDRIQNRIAHLINHKKSVPRFSRGNA